MPGIVQDSPKKIIVIDLTNSDEEDISVEEVEDRRPNWIDAQTILLEHPEYAIDDDTSEISDLSDPEEIGKNET